MARQQHRKARAITAAELMTAPAITVADDTPVRKAARRCARFHVRCMPVLDQAGELVGIVTRSDLLRPYLRGDADIRREVLEDLIPVRLLLDPAQLTVSVSSGMVTLAGEAPRRTDAADLVEAVSGIDGVVAVRDRLRFRTDDMAELVRHGPGSADFPPRSEPTSGHQRPIAAADQRGRRKPCRQHPLRHPDRDRGSRTCGCGSNQRPAARRPRGVSRTITVRISNAGPDPATGITATVSVSRSDRWVVLGVAGQRWQPDQTAQRLPVGLLAAARPPASGSP